MDSDWSQQYDKIFASGRHSGYSDAVTELWRIAHEAIEADDRDRYALLADLAREISGRRAAVEARFLHFQAEARVARPADES
jgi:hypothetical protein